MYTDDTSSGLTGRDGLTLDTQAGALGEVSTPTDSMALRCHSGTGYPHPTTNPPEKLLWIGRSLQMLRCVALTRARVRNRACRWADKNTRGWYTGEQFKVNILQWHCRIGPIKLSHDGRARSFVHENLRDLTHMIDRRLNKKKESNVIYFLLAIIIPEWVLIPFFFPCLPVDWCTANAGG